MTNEIHLELIRLIEVSLKNKVIPVQTTIQFFETTLENNLTILSELKPMNYVESLFKKFLKHDETLDPIS